MHFPSFSFVHLSPGLNTGQKRIKGNCFQKCIEEIANIAGITNSTRIASCGKNLLANFSRNFSKNMLEIACRNLKKSAKVTGHFIATKKNTLIDIARIIKYAKVQSYKEKG